MITLTIAIPTYNREKELKKQLERLDQLKNAEIEILISDNGSTDGTEDLLTDFVKKNTDIRFQRHQMNLGFDANIKSLYSSSSGKFVWFLSDDDPVNAKEILHILQSLKNNPNIGAMCLLLGSSGKTFKSKIVSYANFGKTINFEKEIAFSVGVSQQARTNFGTLISQISTCVVAKIENLELDFEGGGIAHVVIAQRILNVRDNIFLKNSNAVQLSSKEEISEWFMESCLVGTKIAYSNLHSECGENFSRQVVEATRVLGMKVAFWNLNQMKTDSICTLIKKYNPPSITILRYQYIFWFLLCRIGFRFIFIPACCNLVRKSFFVVKQKILLHLDF